MRSQHSITPHRPMLLIKHPRHIVHSTRYHSTCRGTINNHNRMPRSQLLSSDFGLLSSDSSGLFGHPHIQNFHPPSPCVCLCLVDFLFIFLIFSLLVLVAYPLAFQYLCYLLVALFLLNVNFNHYHFFASSILTPFSIASLTIKTN